ncbi:D-alanyl-D-alanine carboxypeptidase/D-alanyl-D-alanine-endopeptidase [Oryzobacter telluris]|uniref:D-alanyl-D-alanine carboxypeptidase/D-alanyl-D-alanine-endopeptidase n=1 Tax=Oryzobacter telluris TaxID=3149179 RepID=UPI00370D4997
MRATTRRPTVLLTVATAVAAALVAGTSGTAHASAGTPTPASSSHTRVFSATAASAADLRMRSALTARATTARFGSAFSGAVIDAESNRVVWSKNGSTALMPASTNKLVTASNALTVFGPTKRFTTTIRAGSAPDRVVVEGSGDPSLSSTQLDTMAKTVAGVLKGRGLATAAVKVYVDDDVFPAPSLATGWKSTYVPDSITAVRGLVRDQSDSSDTSADVGRYVGDRLKAYGITAAAYSGRANAAPTAEVLATSQGQPLSTTVNRMLLVSDNEIAEALHKLVGIAQGRGPTWAGARTAQAEVVARQKLSITALYDGSGLSRSDRLSALQLARVVDRGVDTTNSALWPLRSAQGMPTAGQTGTLSASSKRFVTAEAKCAAGKVWAKTGRLADVVALSGFTKGKDGKVKVFAFVVNGKDSTTTLKQSVDMLAATVNGCY